MKRLEDDPINPTNGMEAGAMVRHTTIENPVTGEERLECDMLFILDEITHEVIAHETTHLALFIWKYLYPRVDVFSNDTEPFAYMMGDLYPSVRTTVMTLEDRYDK